MKVVFMGTPEFAAICLKEILESSHQVTAVVSVADKPAGRGQKISRSAVAKLAVEKNLKLLQPEKLKDPEFISELESLNADAFVVVAFRMLPAEVWKIPKKGTFNLHASLLPQYRGAAPINRAIINGEKESGVTTFLIDDKIDTGNILLTDTVEIGPDENAGELHDKLAEIGKKLIIKTLDGLENDSISPKPQQTFDSLKPAPKIFREDCRIDWNQPIEKIHNLIRGLSPYPAAWTMIEKDGESKIIKLFKGNFEKVSNPDELHKTIDFEGNSMIIRLKNGNYKVEELQPEGKKRMNSTDFINGLHDKSGWRID
ncbi:MAG: methionyl-tRNA formyltransferase [Weeksellaceae bacterium]